MGRAVYRSQIRVSDHEDGAKLCLLHWSEVGKTNAVAGREQEQAPSKQASTELQMSRAASLRIAEGSCHLCCPSDVSPGT